MRPHVNRRPQFDYGYLDAAGEFQNMSRCEIVPDECFPTDRSALFVFKVTDPDLVHEVKGSFYRGAKENVNDRQPPGNQTFSRQFSTQQKPGTAVPHVTMTTRYNVGYTFRYTNERFNGVFFDITVRDQLGGIHTHTYTLQVPERHHGGLHLGYEAIDNGRADVLADGSGTLISSIKYVIFPGFTPNDLIGLWEPAD